MLTVTDPVVETDISTLRADCKRLHVTQDVIAKEAGVTRPLVVNVFAGRNKSRNVVEAALRLVAKAERRVKRKAS